MESLQLILDVLLGLVGFFGSFILLAVWRRLGYLESTDEHIKTEVTALRILVAGEYVKKSDIEPKLDGIWNELREIRKEVSKSNATP